MRVTVRLLITRIRSNGSPSATKVPIAAHAHRKVGMTGDQCRERSLTMKRTRSTVQSERERCAQLVEREARAWANYGPEASRALLRAAFLIRQPLKLGRKPIGDRPMTHAERSRRFRQRHPDYDKKALCDG